MRRRRPARLLNPRWSFHSENASNIFRPHYVGEIWKLDNHRRQKAQNAPLRIRVNHMVIKTFYGFRKPPFTKCFPSTIKCRVGVFKYPCLKKSSVFWRDCVDGASLQNIPAFTLDLLEINTMTSTDQTLYNWTWKTTGNYFFGLIKLEVLKLTYLAINASRI